jgi:hypothetical protein
MYELNASRTGNFGLYGHAESKKSKNLSAARHYDQISFRFYTDPEQTSGGHQPRVRKRLPCASLSLATALS